MGSIHPAVSEICIPQSLDPICTKFDKFLGHGQAHLGQMGKWPWRCTTTGLDNSTELRMEKIHQAVTEIWVPQVWQPPARPPGPWRQYPSSPEGWGVKRWYDTAYSFNTLRLTQNWRHFADTILKCVFLNENFWIPIDNGLASTRWEAIIWTNDGSLLTHVCVLGLKELKNLK